MGFDRVDRMRKKPTIQKSTDIGSLEARLGYTFSSPEHLRTALTHRSYAAEKGVETDNERFEFLGDALVGLLVADSLLQRFPNSAEGVLTRLRAMLVSRKQLGDVGDTLNLGAHLLLGKGEEASGGRAKHVLLANAVEAVIAAIYRDGGLDAARSFVEREVVEPRMPELHAAVDAGNAFGSAAGDYKTALQELLQSHPQAQRHVRPEYTILEDRGHGEEVRFRIGLSVHVDGRSVNVEGEGRSKKAAQQQAAEAAYRMLTDAGTSAGA